MNKFNWLCGFIAMIAMPGLSAKIWAQTQIASRSAAQAILAVARLWSLTLLPVIFSDSPGGLAADFAGDGK